MRPVDSTLRFLENEVSPARDGLVLTPSLRPEELSQPLYEAKGVIRLFLTHPDQRFLLYPSGFFAPRYLDEA